MINAELDYVKTLPEFYTEIRKQHEEAHGHDYCWQHDAMQECMKVCDTYRELGTQRRLRRCLSSITPRKSHW